MTLRHFKVFLAVCETGSMTLAAQNLGMAQPSVSQCIAELESHYGLALFDRVGRRLRIAEAGSALRLHAAQILRAVEEAERGLFDLQDGGSLRVGASMTVGAALLPSMLEKFISSRPRLRLTTRVDNTASIVERLKSAELDLGLVESSSEWAGIVSEAFYEDELCLICPPSHPWVKRGSVKAAELEGRAFLVREEGSGTREVFASAMAAADLGWEVAGVHNGPGSIIALVERGLGISFISRLLAAGAIEAERVAEPKVEGLDTKRKFRIVRHKDRLLTDAMRDFMQLCASWRDGDSAGASAEAGTSA
ncbi:MAG TPA: LysR family transcriptional regulator [Rectinemataceae bacterium]|nr:LysR family transcriptional regulator [Rectinemataceae bacterium]